ncbi:MAG: hypothetical protein JSU94_00110 [Phycisphaerales bacterium]|nr:MAG: hypothetical protein JSU94_00110 [Phycisphaerales bacterium]
MIKNSRKDRVECISRLRDIPEMVVEKIRRAGFDLEAVIRAGCSAIGAQLANPTDTPDVSELKRGQLGLKREDIFSDQRSAADAAGVSTRTLRRWQKEGMPRPDGVYCLPILRACKEYNGAFGKKMAWSFIRTNELWRLLNQRLGEMVEQLSEWTGLTERGQKVLRTLGSGQTGRVGKA